MGCPEDYEFIFSKYSNKLNNELKRYSVLNYMSSTMMAHHLMLNAIKTETGTKLLLSPGVSQPGSLFM
jgi:alpha-amylase